MQIEFDLGRALFLTYVGVGAAFLVLGSLVVFTGLIGWWGNWRYKRAQAREREAAAQARLEEQPAIAAAESPAGNPQLAAAIAAAVGLAIEARSQEQAAEERQRLEEPAAGNGGWREQGRLAAFDSRRLRERER